MSRFRIIALVLCTMIFVLPGRPALADAAATQSIDSDMARLLPEGVAQRLDCGGGVLAAPLPVDAA